jgi:tetratricopeptide (TPR) repeat protein
LLGLTHLLWAISLGKESKFDQAVAESQKAIVLYPNLALAHDMLGADLFYQDKQKEAIKPLKKARDLYRVEGKIQEAENIERILHFAESWSALE